MDTRGTINAHLFKNRNGQAAQKWNLPEVKDYIATVNMADFK